MYKLIFTHLDVSPYIIFNSRCGHTLQPLTYTLFYSLPPKRERQNSSPSAILEHNAMFYLAYLSESLRLQCTVRFQSPVVILMDP